MTDLAFPKRTTNNGKHAERLTEKQFRDAVWIRDEGKDRATGLPLVRGAATWDTEGQVCHLKARRVMPEWARDPDRAILLSARNHMFSDARGQCRLKLTDPETGEPATDARKPIRFTMYDKEGLPLWTSVR